MFRFFVHLKKITHLMNRDCVTGHNQSYLYFYAFISKEVFMKRLSLFVSAVLLAGSPALAQVSTHQGPVFTFLNPDPIHPNLPNFFDGDYFGTGIAVTSSGKVVISTPGVPDREAFNGFPEDARVGTVYIFDGIGNSSVSVQKKFPSLLDTFGVNLTTIGDQIFVTAPSELIGQGASARAGALYAFSASGSPGILAAPVFTSPYLLSEYDNGSVPAVGNNFPLGLFLNGARIAGNESVFVSDRKPNPDGGSAYVIHQLNGAGGLVRTLEAPDQIHHPFYDQFFDGITPLDNGQLFYPLAVSENRLLASFLSSRVRGIFEYDFDGNLTRTYLHPDAAQGVDFGSVSSIAFLGDDVLIGELGGDIFQFNDRTGDSIRTID